MTGCAPAESKGPDEERRLQPPDGYVLAWADEFDTPGSPDPARWAYDTEFNQRGWHNDEQQYYAADRAKNARVEHGRLIIQAHAERLEEAADWGGQRFTSARLITRERASWTYGFFEVRAKLPCARGTWPAIWLLPATRDPDFANGEIDIAEHVAQQPGRVHQSIHTAARNFRRGNHPTVAARVTDACTNFNDYQLHWTADEIVMGVNGRRTFSYRRKSDARGSWPFDGPFHLIINLALGGTWAGARGIDTDALPTQLEIEHVRVFRGL